MTIHKHVPYNKFSWYDFDLPNLLVGFGISQFLESLLLILKVSEVGLTGEVLPWSVSPAPSELQYPVPTLEF